MNIADIDPDFSDVSGTYWGKVGTIRLKRRHKRKGGTCFPVEVRGAKITLQGKRFILAHVRDITEEEQLKEELFRARQEAEYANRTKSEFLANMSHEIRTPLNGLTGMLKLMSSTSLAPEQQELLGHALSAGNRLTRLLSDILDLSRVEAGKMDIVMAAFDFRDAMDAIVQLFEPSAREKGVTIQVTISPAIPEILLGDAPRLQQILSNLVGNAVKFTDHGRIEMDAYPLPPRTPGEFRVLFSVTDTGIGIADDVLGRLFTPFTQGERSYTRRFQGAGLGLVICSRLIKTMGGTVTAESEEGSMIGGKRICPFRYQQPRQKSLVSPTFRCSAEFSLPRKCRVCGRTNQDKSGTGA